MEQPAVEADAKIEALAGDTADAKVSPADNDNNNALGDGDTAGASVTDNAKQGRDLKEIVADA